MFSLKFIDFPMSQGSYGSKLGEPYIEDKNVIFPVIYDPEIDPGNSVLAVQRGI